LSTKAGGDVPALVLVAWTSVSAFFGHHAPSPLSGRTIVVPMSAPPPFALSPPICAPLYGHPL